MKVSIDVGMSDDSINNMAFTAVLLELECYCYHCRVIIYYTDYMVISFVVTNLLLLTYVNRERKK